MQFNEEQYQPQNDLQQLIEWGQIANSIFESLLEEEYSQVECDASKSNIETRCTLSLILS